MRWLRRWPQRASCGLLRVEGVRAVEPHGPEAVARARRALRRLALVRLDDELLDAAADLPSELRSLDAIHLAAARALGADLGALVTYDRRMAGAAAELGMPVVAP